MRRVFLLTILLVTLACWGKGNKVDMEYFPIDKARYKAVYSLNFIEDTVKRKIKSTLATLLIGDSVVVYADKHLIDSDSVGYTYSLSHNGAKVPAVALVSYMTGVKLHHYIYKNYPSNNKQTLRCNFIDNNSYTESIPTQEWTETGLTKEINGLTCNEAFCSFHGRDYVAYYSPDIPLRYGPDVFGGLPGLIMELQDGNSEYIWSLQDFEPCDYEHVITINRKDLKELSRDNYREVEQKFRNNPWMMNPDDPMLKKFKPKPYNPVEKY